MHGPTPPNRPRDTSDGGKTCAVCEKPSITRCSKCKEVMYCSVECQRLDWKAGHKQVCCSGTSASALAAKSAAAAALPPPWEPFKPDPEVEALIDEGAAAPVTGMANVGNTCFLNVVVQCLFHGPLWHYMQRGLPRHKPPAEHEQGCGEPDCVICELNELVRMYANPGARKWITPRSVVRKTLSACASIGVDFGRMHDSHEFAIAGIINRLLNANLRGAPEASGSDEYDCLECQTLQHHLFGALYASVVTCESCGHQTGRMQRDANGFTLALTGRTPETPETGLRAWVRGAAQRVGERVGVVEEASESVEELLKFDFEGESLEDYKCDGCGKKMDEMDGKRIVKRSSLVDAPRVLTLVIKRFSGGHFGKVSKPVTFDEELDLGPFVEPALLEKEGVIGEPDEHGVNKTRDLWRAHQRASGEQGRCLYTLTGVVVHSGVMNSVNAGHYTAFVKSADQWYLVDDEEVTKSSWASVSKATAYMLFYRRLPAEPAQHADPDADAEADAAASAASSSAALAASSSTDADAPTPLASPQPSASEAAEEAGSGAVSGGEAAASSEERKADGLAAAAAGMSAGGAGEGGAGEGGADEGAGGDEAGSSEPALCHSTSRHRDSSKFEGDEYYKLCIPLPGVSTLVHEQPASMISEKRYTFKSSGHDVDVEWPSPVDETRAHARFVRSRSELQVFAPLAAE